MTSTWAAIRAVGIERDCKKEERKLKAVYDEMRRHPARYRHALDGIAVHERIPRWMQPVMPRLSDVAEAGALMGALRLCCGGQMLPGAVGGGLTKYRAPYRLAH